MMVDFYIFYLLLFLMLTIVILFLNNNLTVKEGNANAQKADHYAWKRTWSR